MATKREHIQKRILDQYNQRAESKKQIHDLQSQIDAIKVKADRETYYLGTKISGIQSKFTKQRDILVITGYVNHVIALNNAKDKMIRRFENLMRTDWLDERVGLEWRIDFSRNSATLFPFPSHPYYHQGGLVGEAYSPNGNAVVRLKSSLKSEKTQLRWDTRDLFDNYAGPHGMLLVRAQTAEFLAMQSIELAQEIDTMTNARWASEDKYSNNAKTKQEMYLERRAVSQKWMDRSEHYTKLAEEYRTRVKTAKNKVK